MVPVEVREVSAEVASPPAATAVLSKALTLQDENSIFSAEPFFSVSYAAAAVVLVSRPAPVRDAREVA